MTFRIPITSSELATLWMTYQKDKMMITMMDYFLVQIEDSEAKQIVSTYYESIDKLCTEIEQILTNEGAIVPIAFNNSDVRKDAPPLFDNMSEIMFLRIMMKVDLGFNVLHLGMSYRKDIRDFFKRCVIVSQDTYDMCSEYLLKNGVLACPPYVTMPKLVEFIEDKKYTKGIKIFGKKRTLNTIELAHIYQSIESNIFGAQLMTGFAQAAKETEVKDYFIKGKELAKKIISNFTDVLQQSDIQPPSTWVGRATDSRVAPFSDKVMVFCTTLLSGYALGSNALGTSLSMRNDLPLKLFVVMKDTYQYAVEGGKLLIQHKWMEEPPQMEDRSMLTKPLQ